MLLPTRLATGCSLSLGLSRCRTGVWKDCGFGSGTILKPLLLKPHDSRGIRAQGMSLELTVLIETTHLGSGLNEAQAVYVGGP